MRGNQVRLLRRDEAADVIRLCERDRLTNVFVNAHVQAHGLMPATYAGQVWGYFRGTTLVSACFAGANLVPVQADTTAARLFAHHALTLGKFPSSVVGPSDVVRVMWEVLRPDWGPAREERWRQPLMVIDHEPWVQPDPAVRVSDPSDLDLLYPASVAMFTEEVGYSPVADDDDHHYRSRVRDVIARGHSFVHTDLLDGEPTVVFKAELGAVTDHVVQLQGVWVHPRWRGKGLAAGFVAQSVAIARRHRPVSVTLYVNDFNQRAIRTYRKVGFRTIGTFATIVL